MFIWITNSILLGVGLAMDAFSVSMANGLLEPGMKKYKQIKIAATFGGFQYLMPMIGWVCVHTIVKYFKAFEKAIPWIALILLSFIGLKMLVEGIKTWSKKEPSDDEIGHGTLIVQGIATSIDALSVGFTIAEQSLVQALITGAIIGVVTFLICIIGLLIGKKLGTALAGKASVLGGLILIGIGLEIFINGL